MIACATLGFVGFVGYKLHNYYSFDTQTIPDEIDWSVHKISSSKYIIVGRYTFSVADNAYSGETSFKGMIYVNPWAAEKALEVFESRSLPVWYNSHDASSSTIDRVFPTKFCIYSSALLAVMIYFCGLAVYVKKKTS